MGLGATVPILRIFDEEMARDFYVGFLGFDILFEHRFEPDLPLYMAIKRDECELHLSGHFGDASPGARIRIQCSDLTGYAKSLSQKAYKYARPGPPCLQPWGDLELTVTDPFGNRLTFWEPGP